MTGRRFHIVLLMAALLVTGCVREVMPSAEEPGIKLTVKCGETFQSKADTREGVKDFNENLIRSVDFLFYRGTSPAADADAVFHIRKVLEQDPMESAPWEATFNLVIKKDVIGTIFTEANDNKAFVYVLVNCEASLLEELYETSRNDLAAKRILTDFAADETAYVYPQFLMDGSAIVQYDPDAVPNVDAEIEVRRFASKLTVGVHVNPTVVLKHQNSEQYPDETWEPVLHTMRVYLVDGKKSVLISHDGSLPDAKPIDPNPVYFSYKNDAAKRPYVRENGTAYLPTETVGDKEYYTTWPMYSYPSEWSSSMANYADEHYEEHDNKLPPEPPYFKLEMDWRRLKDANYDYDRRKYYYKVFLPFNELKRNSWYGFYVDVSILGAETDEGKALLEPTCYLLDWQNKSLAINKSAVISKARYLSLDKSDWEINNMEELSIPFLSSHNVKVVSGSVTATRPFYGEIGKNGYVMGYNAKLHAYIKGSKEEGYYLDYVGQPEGSEKWEPANWLTNTSTSINLNHPLVNNNTKDDFDYSSYTIDFDIVHTDLEEGSHTYSQYLRHITITQHPGIYIERLRNSDTQIQKRVNDGKDQGLYGYPDGKEPWTDKPWGYVYVNGGRFIRHETTSHTGTEDAYFSLHSSNKKEYQWQTVWYTGGSKDIYDIHVTVLPSNSTFVIGDPRLNTVNNLNDASGYPNLYEFTVGGKDLNQKWEDLKVLENLRPNIAEYPEVSYGVWRRTGFNAADALYGDEWRSLQWYYPTENSSRTENMVAPSYRISSKFSGIEFGNLDKKYAEYRCAAFQEDGFPAGRWRLPTKAEINFIGQLSAKGFFEFLFNNGSVYWSANGAIKVSGTSVVDDASSTALLRCVYDSWYWDEVDGLEGDPRHNPRDRFVWGDKER